MATTILGTIDAGGEGKAVLLAALNQALGKNFTLAEFTFSDPEAITIPTPTRNTVIKLAPLAASGYYGVRKVYYNRIHVSELGQIVVVRGAATRVSDLLPQINEKYGVFIQPTDIYDSLLPAVVPGETEVQITLNFRPSSIIFYGGVQIILGSNDPNAGSGGGGGPVLPFAGELMLFTTQATKRLPEGGFDETYIIDPFSTYIDADKTRKRFASVLDDTGTPSFDRLFKRTYPVSKWQNLQKKELIAYSWRNSINEAFAINIYGDVFKAALNGLSWTFLSNAMGFDSYDMPFLTDVQDNKPLIHVARTPTGEIYVVHTLSNNSIRVRKSVDEGATWNEVHLVGSTNNHGYSISAYQSGDVYFEDSMVHGGKLWTIVYSNLPYVSKAGSEPAGPAIECMDLTTFAKDYFTLGEVFGKYSQQYIDFVRGESRLTFVTPENDLVAFPRVAGLGRLRNSSRMVLVMYTKNGAGYEAEIIGNANLPNSLIDDNNRFISSYSIPLQKDENLSLDVIELGCRVPTNTLPYETYAMGVYERTQEGFKTYGVKVYTSVRSGTARNNWVESNVSLGDGSAHKRVLINTPSKRMHFVAQPENALARIRFTEDNAIAGFRASADVSIALDKHSGFSTLSGHGAGVYSNPVVLETLNTSYSMTEFIDEESGKLPINYSFIARDQQNNYKWLVSSLPNSPLQERTFSREYSYIGKIPLLVGANGNDLFVWSQVGNGIFRSGDGGNFWEFNGQTEVFYNQQLSDKPERNIMGMAEIAVKPELFKTGSIINDVSIIDIQFAEAANVANTDNSDFNEPITFNDRVLFFNNGLPDPNNHGYGYQGPLGGYGVNFFGAYAPKKVQAWEADSSTNGVTGVSYITTDNAQPYGVLEGRTNYSANIENDFVVLHINTKVKFLDIDQIIYGYRIISGNEVHQLKLVDNSGVVTTVELFGGSNPVLATFKPKAAFGLWEFADANYVPYIYYDDKKILLITRLREDGTFTNTIHLINVPADNGGALDIVPMFNANRREYYFAQRSNGIFKLNYTYNALTKTAVLSLNRVFTLNGTAANLTIVSGTVRELPVVIEPTVPLIPTFPPNGTLISTFCDGTTKTGVYADGSGGTYNQVVELESPDCGFTPGTPTPVGATTTTMTLNTTSATADLIETSVVAAENGTAYAIYELSAGLNANTDVVLSFIPGTASLADISAIAYRIGNGSFIAASLPQTITIPAGQTEIVVRITYVADGVTEGNELFTLRVAKSVGNTQITNTDPIDTIFTITDYVAGSRWPINNKADYLDDFENANKTWSSTNFQALYDSPNANPVSTNYIAQDKVLRVVQNPVQSGNRQHTNLLPLGDIRFSNIRYTVDLFISKVLVQDTVSGDYSLIDYDAPLTGNQQYEESGIRLSSYDQDANSYGTDISVFFCLSGTTDQMVHGGNSGSKTQLGTRVDSTLGTSMVTIPRGGDIRLTIEITDDGAGKKHQVFVNDILVHTAGSGQYVAGSLIAVGAMLRDLSCQTVDIRRVMIEDIGAPVVTPPGELIPTTWSSSLSEPSAVLSNSDLTVTATNRAVTEFSAVTGKYYVEITGDATYIGVADVSEDSSAAPGTTNYSVAYKSTDGYIYVNSVGAGAIIQPNATVVRIMIDVDNKLVQFAADGNASSTPIPLLGDAFRVAIGDGTATINAGASAFAYPVPEGYTPGFGQDTNPANNTLAFTATRMNSLDAGSSVSLNDTGLVANFGYYSSSVRSKLSVNSGKWAIEVKPTANIQYTMFGISTSAAPVQRSGGAYPGVDNNGWSYYSATGELYRNDVGTPYGVLLQSGDIVTMLIDMDNGTLSFLVNGVDQGVAVTGISGDYFAHFGDGASTSTAMEVNFGSKPFTYPVPAGFVKGFGVENIVPTKYNSVIPKSLGDFAEISNGGDYVIFSGYPASNVQSYRKVSTGKWAWEVQPTNDALALRIGICRPTVVAQVALGTSTAEGYGYQGEMGDVNSDVYGEPFTNGDVITVLLDLDNGTLSYMKNGVNQGIAASGLTGEWRASVSKTATGFYPRVDTNFGDRPFKYPVPAGYVKGFGHIR